MVVPPTGVGVGGVGEQQQPPAVGRILEGSAKLKCDESSVKTLIYSPKFLHCCSFGNSNELYLPLVQRRGVFRHAVTPGDACALAVASWCFSQPVWSF